MSIRPSAEVLCGCRRRTETGNCSHLIHTLLHTESRMRGKPMGKDAGQHCGNLAEGPGLERRHLD